MFNVKPHKGIRAAAWDIGFASGVTDISINNGGGVPDFNIYIPKTGEYINYDRNSMPDDFPAYPNLLPEVILTKPKKSNK